LTELPTAGFHVAGQDIFRLLTYHHDGYVSLLRERAGERDVPGITAWPIDSILPEGISQEDFAFALSRHELSLPLHIGPYHFAPTVIGTYVHDESRFYDSVLADPRYDTRPGRKDFVQGAAGFRAGTQLWHVDNSVHSRLWDLDRLRHIVIPEVSAFWIDTNLEQAPRHDVFNFALRQRWQTMRGRQGQKRSVDFLRLNTSVTLVTNDVEDATLPGKFLFSRPEWQFDPSPIINHDLANLNLARREQLNQNLSDHADADWAWLISETTAFTGAFNYNIRQGAISQANTDLVVQRSPRTRYSVGYRFLQNGDPFVEEDLKNSIFSTFQDAHVLSASAGYRINRKYTVAVSHQYDIAQAAASYTRATVIRKFVHWFGAFSVSYDATRKGLSFMVSFWPEGYDKFAIGSRRFTRLAP